MAIGLEIHIDWREGWEGLGRGGGGGRKVEI